MLLFLLLLLPLSVVLFFINKKEKKYSLVIYLGFITGIIVCAISFIFSYPHRIIPDSFLQNYLYYFFKLTVLPLLLVPAAFCVFSKNSKEFKAECIFPLMASFYSVYFPYYIMSMTESRYSGYDIILRPLIYLSMIIYYSILAKHFVVNSIKVEIKEKTAKIVLSVLCLLFPAFVDSFMAINRLTYIACVLSILYVVCALFLVFKSYRQISKIE